ncbi:MAG: DNA cytosine methyltransferase [Mycobacteriales bacterium]
MGKSTQNPEKPAFRIPTMDEIAATKKNGFVVVSTFSGCGGSCLGFRMAGFKVAWASEFIPAARETYLTNYPQTPVDGRDIRLVTAKEIRKVIGDVDVDVLEGSPPCASFSTAGKRSAAWNQVRKYSDSEQRVDDLFFEYARLVGELKPKVFVAENVSGLVKGVAKGYFKEILAALKAKGYEVKAQVLDAQWLGVPQMRQRLIFIGVRNDLVEKFGVHPAHPVPLKYRYSVKDAIPWIDSGIVDTGGDFAKQRFGRTPCPTIKTQTSSHHYKVTSEIIMSAHGYRKVGKDVGKNPAAAVKSSPDSASGSVRQTIAIEEQESPWQIQDRERRIDGSGPAPTVLTHGRGFSGIVVADRPSRGKRESAKVRVAKGFKDETWVDASTRPFPTVGSGPNFGCNLNNNGGKIRVSVGSVEDGGAFKNPKPRPVSMASATIGSSPSSGNGRMPPSKVIEKTESETRERKLTIAELKRICSFPDDFILRGSYAQQWERLGRAVPPLMMAACARVIRDEILMKVTGNAIVGKCRAGNRSRKDSGKRFTKQIRAGSGSGKRTNRDTGKHTVMDTIVAPTE